MNHSVVVDIDIYHNRCFFTDIGYLLVATISYIQNLDKESDTCINWTMNIKLFDILRKFKRKR